MIVAELSCSHNGSLYNAKLLMLAAKDAGADAVKLQTFTPGSMTLDSDRPEFKLKDGLWKGRNLHELYAQAATPLAWHAELFAYAAEIGLICFSSPFDVNAVNFLEQIDCPIYKIASFELTDLQLIARCAATGKPMIMSTGMASDEDIMAALDAAEGASEVTLLHCVSAYPTPVDRANLQSMQALKFYNRPVGLSDHSLSLVVPAIAVALGASVIEKHIKLSGDTTSLDAAFALNPREFEVMVENIETAQAALSVTPPLEPLKDLRRSLYVVEDVEAGQPFTPSNVRSIRPGHGLPPLMLPEVFKKRAAQSLSRGTALQAAHLA